MKRLPRLYLLLILSAILPLAGFQPVLADAPALIITEIKVRNDTAGLDEFIELYNPGQDNISLNEYFIGYVNTPNPTVTQEFSEAVIATGLLPAGQSLVLAKNELDPNLPGSKKSPFSSLSDNGGTIRVTNNNGVVIDQFAWTSTESLAIAPIVYLCTSVTVACNLNRSQSFERSKDQDNVYDPINPTWQLGTTSPQSVSLLPLPVPEPEPEPTAEPEPEPTDIPSEADPPVDTPAEPDSEPEPVVMPDLIPPQITELLPNPAPPASDSIDEYIELYNPNDQPFDLTGYKLQTGNTFSYSYVFTASSLGAGEHKVFMVSETGNILSNSGGMARLLDQNGVGVAQTNAYDDAGDGDAWALVNGAWQWTTTPTPNAVNQLTLPVLKVAAPKATTPKKTTAKAASKKTTSKAATTKTKVASAKTPKAATTAERQEYEEPEAGPRPINAGILAGIGVITILYAAYEYRQDAINKVRQFRRYRELRRAARPKT